MHRVTPLTGASSSWSGNLSWTEEGLASRKLGVAEGCGAWWARAPRGDGWRRSEERREPNPAEGRNLSSEGPEPERGSAGAGGGAEAEMRVQRARQSHRAGGPGRKDRLADSEGTGSGAQARVAREGPWLGPRFRPDQPPRPPLPGAGGAARVGSPQPSRKRPPLGAHRGARGGAGGCGTGAAGAGPPRCNRIRGGGGEGPGRAGRGWGGGAEPGSGPAGLRACQTPHCSQLMSLAVVSGRLSRGQCGTERPSRRAATAAGQPQRGRARAGRGTAGREVWGFGQGRGARA